MDKSFNDQELSDIMKEIEALEDEFQTQGEVTPVLEELAALDEETSIPVQTPEAKVISIPPKKAVTETKTNSGTTMSFKVQGDMKLDLNFEVGGKTVSLNVSEAGLTIVMEGGMTFTVPVTEATQLKKTA